MELNLESLGITKEEIQERVISRICETILTSMNMDEDGEEYAESSQFKKTVEQKCREHINATISKIAEQHILPNVSTFIETLALQETNSWGEKIGKPLTFIEYLASRADAYLRETVSSEGKSKGEDSYSWTGRQPRLTYLVHKHLQYSIDTAMKSAVDQVNAAIVPALTETVKLKLGEISANLKTTVTTK